MGVFKVLMWKHYMVRKRRIIQTIIEFTAPISLILGLFILRDSMRSKTAQIFDLKIDTLSNMMTSEPPLRILYTPNTMFTHTLMEQVGKKLNLRHVNLMENKNESGYCAYWNSSDAKEFYKHMRPDDVIVEFELDKVHDFIPDTLNYTLRVKRPLADISERTQFRTNEFETARDSLLRLQWAIDSTFVMFITKTKLKNIVIKEFSNRRASDQEINRFYLNIMFYLLAYTSFLSPLLPFIFLMTRLLEERSSGIQELVKMVGVTPTMLGITQYINSLPPCLIYSIGSTFLLKCTSEPMVPETHVIILFLGLFLHYNTIIAMCFTCSYMAKNSQYTVSLAMFVYIGMWIPIRVFEHDGKSDAALFFLGLLPHCPAYWFVNEVNVAEVWYDTGVNFGNWEIQYALHPSGGKNACVMVSFIMQLIQITYFYIIAWYLEKVRPGRYGIALPWNFIFQKDYWAKRKPIPTISGPSESYDPAYQKYFEDPPVNMEVGIEILHVTKIFGSGAKSFQALTDLSLNIYKGEITVLLGHNGAGKTTLISIITGMINPTSGRILVNGLDTVTQQTEVRKHLGFCPQHNLFFPDLTVLEHFLFFSMIKGGTIKEATQSSYILLDQLDLTAKMYRKTSELSGGMLRRLQLGCALCGDASVLILDEPTSGLDVEARRELWDMLLELVKMVGVTPTMLGITQYINSLPPCLIYSIGSTFLLKCTSEPMVPETHVIILFLGLFLHYNTIIAMCFTCSYMAKNYTGVNFGNWEIQYALHPSGGKNACVMVSFIMQLIQITYFYIIAWYLEKVRPGRYGIALPWNFIFQKDYWAKRKPIPTISGPSESYDPAYQKYFEDPPVNMEVGIEILHVTKIFGSGAKSFQALTDLSLNIYKGEITVLLGHNGAGKTTLISIITGMINPTSGRILVNGLDTVTQQTEVRKHLGFCPQHNLFFPDLTVLEHFLFFSMIKGGTIKEATQSSYILLDQLDLTAKMYRKTSELSGGMLRRLQLGCALCGDASVLILDEPTSGLDVEARRELWDMLLALRGDRTMVLTTHFMEEADVLGDRLAALHAGRLRCHATPMFLKRAVGSDFHLTIRSSNPENEKYITRCVHDVVPGARFKENTGAALVYELPPGTNMSTLFNTIEKRKAELGIDSVGVGITSLEEVFLELCCDVDAASIIHEETRSSSVIYVTGCRQILRQMGELFRRQLNFTRSRILAYVILQVIMPFIMCIMLTQLFNNGKAQLEALLDDTSFATLSAPVATFDIIDGFNKTLRRSNAIRKLRKIYPKLMFRNLVAGTDGIRININNSKFSNLNKNVFGIEINESQAIIHYEPKIKLSAHVALNILSNYFIRRELRSAENKAINTKISIDWPVRTKLHIPKDKINCSLFAIFNIFIILATCVNDVILPCKERLTVARHTHLMTGCPPYLYWLTTFLYHIAGYVIFCCSATMIAAAFFDTDKTIDDNATLSAYMVALLLCGIDLYAFSYFVSFYVNERGASMLLIALTIVFGFLSPILMMALEDLNTTEKKPVFSVIMDVLGIGIPAHVFTQTVVRMTDTSRFNSFCVHNFDKCPALPYFSDGFDADHCCSEGSATYGPFNHFAFNKFAMGYNLIVVVLQFFTFTTLVLLLEYGYLNRWWNFVGKQRTVQKPQKKYDSPEVVTEKLYANETIKLDRNQITDTMLMCNVWKTYFRLFGKPTFALRDLNFSIKKGECFGLIGVNGAGKTTTFKVAACEESATEGTVFVNGHFVGTEQYIRSLGYCPQFFGLDEFRTGADNLRMLLVLRGFSTEDVKRETTSWLNVVGMTRHANRVVAGYSGGMVRRLATAASLCSGAPITLLDEPTAGVDTAARRLLWSAMKRGLMNDRSIVLASNCIDEMEMLCHRVTILKEGEMCVLGTPLALREQYAAGHSIVLKLRVSVVLTHAGYDKALKLKQSMTENFNCTLKDQHLTSLHYQVHGKLLYSTIFDKMGHLAREYSDLIEDYSVTDTTLEDVFLYVNET